MTKAKALALVAALEAQTVPCTVALSFPPGGGEQWDVSIPTGYVATGAQLAQLAAYCQTNALTLTAQFSYLGVT